MMTCSTTRAIVLTALVVAGCSTTGSPTAVGPPTVVFADEDGCRTVTGAASCGFAMCDYVPEGRTLDEVCGVNFQEGIQVTAPDRDVTTADVLVDQLATCAVASVTRDEEFERDQWVRNDGITMTVVGSDPAVESALATAADDCGTLVDR